MIENCSIYFTKPCMAELCPSEIKALEDHEVLVKQAVSTVSSGTERANLIGEKNVRPSRTVTDVPFPRISGYSSAGVVVQVGKQVKSVAVGDRVALSWSTHSKYVVMPEGNVHGKETASYYICEFNPSGKLCF